MDFALAAIGLGHSGIHHLDHHGGNVRARAIALDERDDGLVRHVQAEVCIDGDFFAFGRNLDVLVHREVLRLGAKTFGEQLVRTIL